MGVKLGGEGESKVRFWSENSPKVTAARRDATILLAQINAIPKLIAGYDTSSSTGAHEHQP